MKKLVKVDVTYKNAESVKAVYVDGAANFSNSRYKNASYLLNKRDVQMSSLYPEDLKIESSTYTTYVVPASERNRLDLIANKFFGSPEFYWVLALFNDIEDPLILEVGTELKIPPVSALYTVGGVLR